MQHDSPSESIFGAILALTEVGLQIYIFVTQNKKCGIAIDEEKAKEILSPSIVEKWTETDGKLFFEGKNADVACEELIKAGLITNEKFKSVLEENPCLFEDEYFPESDFELEDFEL